MRYFWAPNGSFAPNKFFFWKKLISFSSIYWPLSFCKIFKKISKTIQMYEDVPFSGPKYPNFSWTKSFLTNHYYYFHLPIGPFNWVKFKKIRTVDPELWRCNHFWAQNGIFAPNKFFWKIIHITFIYLLAPFIEQNI